MQSNYSQRKNIKTILYSLPIWGMKFKDKTKKPDKKMEGNHSFRDHLEDGGFGSWERINK